ncbi:hypothetical protein QMG52_21280 [Paenarthrobacter sp. PH39-S1]|nr:hypothetical protein [Paenarthrobacter sp. PH39-S1]
MPSPFGLSRLSDVSLWVGHPGLDRRQSKPRTWLLVVDVFGVEQHSLLDAVSEAQLTALRRQGLRLASRYTAS